MTDMTDAVDPGGHNSERFRAELLLQLPAASADFGDDYVPEALAAWILEQAAEAYAAGVVDGESGPILQGAAEVATAAGRLEVYADVVPYLEQVAKVLKQGHTMAGQWDLARTIEAEAAKMRTAVQALVRAYPALAGVLGG